MEYLQPLTIIVPILLNQCALTVRLSSFELKCWCIWQIKSDFDSEIVFNYLYLICFISFRSLSDSRKAKCWLHHQSYPQQASWGCRHYPSGGAAIPTGSTGVSGQGWWNAKFVDVQQRDKCGVEDALYFVDRQRFPPFCRISTYWVLC